MRGRVPALLLALALLAVAAARASAGPLVHARVTLTYQSAAAAATVAQTTVLKDARIVTAQLMAPGFGAVLASQGAPAAVTLPTKDFIASLATLQGAPKNKRDTASLDKARALITGVVDPRGNKSGFNSSSPVRVTGSLTNVTLKGAALRCAFTAAPFVRSNAGLPLGPANSNSNSNTLKLTSPSLAFDLVLPCDVLSWGSVDACALAAASAPLAPADTLLVLPLGRKTVKFTPNGTLSLPVGPLVPFFGLTAEVTPGGVLSQLQAASLVTRVRSFLLKARPVAKLSGLARGNKAQTSLAVQLVNASFDARKGLLTFQTAPLPTPAGGAGGGRRRLLQAPPGTYANWTVATLTSACQGCVYWPWLGQGYYTLTGFPLGYGSQGIDPGYQLGAILSPAGVAAASTQSLGSQCTGSYTMTQYGSSSDMQQSSMTSIGMSGSYGGSAFGANAQWGQQSTYMTNQSYTSWASVSQCTVVESQIAATVCNVALNGSFVAAVGDLVQFMNLGDWSGFYGNLADFLTTFGNIVVTEVQLGGVSTATYAQSSSAMASAQSKGFSFSAQGGYAAASGSASTSANSSAESIINSENIQMTWSVAPGPGIVTTPFVPGGSTINGTAWQENLNTADIGTLAPITSITQPLSVVFSCAQLQPTNSWTGSNLTASDLSSLSGLIQQFITNCGNATYGQGMSCTPPGSYCTPGFYATSSGPAPSCSPCFSFGGGSTGCSASNTAFCTGPGQCICNCGYSGGGCDNVCWYGNCDGKYDFGNDICVVEGTPTCSPVTPYAWSNYNKDGGDQGKCPCYCYVSPKGDGTHGAGNSCGTSQPAPEGPYMQLCSGCEMSNQWLLTCKSCNNNTDVVPLSMCTASANGCGAFNNVGVCNLQNGSAALNCGAACPARR